MEIIYNKNIKVSNQFLTPKQTSLKPVLSVSLSKFDTNKYYTLIMYDPNAVTNSGYFIHWIIVDIHSFYKLDRSKLYELNIDNSNTLLDYKGPAPPKGSGIHNYIFVLYEQKLLTNLNYKISRDISIHHLLTTLDLTNEPIYRLQFTIQYMYGGKISRRRNKTRLSKSRKNKKNNIKKENISMYY